MEGLSHARIPARVHLIGVGGVGMAGLARLLLQSGCRVSGSDSAPNRLTAAVEDLGGMLYSGHRRSNLPAEVDWAVRTPAVSETNPEVAGLRDRGIPVFSRGQVLAAFSRSRQTVAVAGAHGKTTTSAMLAWMLHHSPVGCGYAIGGETALPGAVADLGPGKPFVMEADESDGTLVYDHPEIALLTHVEWDHPERFPTGEALWACYRKFIQQSSSIWVREDDARALDLTANHPQVDRVGVTERATIQLLNQKDHPLGQDFRIQISGAILDGQMKLPGVHNTWNALLALGAALRLGVDPAEALEALKTFPSVGRRFQVRETAGVRIAQDYAHHPTELRAALVSLRALGPRRMRVVFQPHRYSRTLRLLDEFATAFSGLASVDLLPVYAASELPAQGVDSDALEAACRRNGTTARLWTDRNELVDALNGWAREGDLIALLGAGNIGELFEWIDPSA